MGKRKNRTKKQPDRIRCQEIPRYKPELRIAEDIEEPSEPKPDRPQPSRGGTLRFYEYTVFPRIGVAR